MPLSANVCKQTYDLESPALLLDDGFAGDGDLSLGFEFGDDPAFGGNDFDFAHDWSMSTPVAPGGLSDMVFKAITWGPK